MSATQYDMVADATGLSDSRENIFCLLFYRSDFFMIPFTFPKRVLLTMLLNHHYALLAVR